METHKLKIEKPGNIRDKEVIAQVPNELTEALGTLISTGYDLRMSRREMYFENGMVTYWPYKTKCEVSLGTLEELGLIETVIEAEEQTSMS